MSNSTKISQVLTLVRKQPEAQEMVVYLCLLVETRKGKRSQKPKWETGSCVLWQFSPSKNLSFGRISVQFQEDAKQQAMYYIKRPPSTDHNLC